MGRRIIAMMMVALASVASIAACSDDEGADPETDPAVAVCAQRAQLAQSLQLLRGSVATGNAESAVAALEGVDATLAQAQEGAAALPDEQRQRLTPVVSGLEATIAGVRNAQGSEQTLARARAASDTMTATIGVLGEVYGCPPITGVDNPAGTTP